MHYYAIKCFSKTFPQILRMFYTSRGVKNIWKQEDIYILDYLIGNVY